MAALLSNPITARRAPASPEREIARLREEVRALREEVEGLRYTLREIAPDGYELQSELGLAPIEARLVAYLLRREGKIMPTEAIMHALYHDRDEGFPPVAALWTIISRLRKRCPGVEISTYPRTGYSARRIA